MDLKNLFNRITRRQVPNDNYPNFVNISDQVYPEMIANDNIHAGMLGPEFSDEINRSLLREVRESRQLREEYQDNVLPDYNIMDPEGRIYLMSANEPIAIPINENGKAYPNYIDDNGRPHYAGVTLGSPGTGGFFKEKITRLPSVIPAAGAAVAGAALPVLFSNLKGNALPALGNAAIKLLK